MSAHIKVMNTARTQCCHIFFVCSGVAIQMRFPLYSCPSLSGVLPHLLFLQNLPSVVVGHVLGPCPGEIILDMCAAPGLSSVPAIWNCKKGCKDDLKRIHEGSELVKMAYDNTK